MDLHIPSSTLLSPILALVQSKVCADMGDFSLFWIHLGDPLVKNEDPTDLPRAFFVSYLIVSPMVYNSDRCSLKGEPANFFIGLFDSPNYDIIWTDDENLIDWLIKVKNFGELSH